MQLNRTNLGLDEVLPIRVVQFGEGNFLRAFVDVALQRLNQQAHYNGAVAVVQPLPQGLVAQLAEQDGLYTVFERGIVQGALIERTELITNLQRCIDPYTDFEAFRALAQEPDLELIVSNTTEAGIAYLASDRPDHCPPQSFPAKLAVLLYERYRHFGAQVPRSLRVIPCELIDRNADTLHQVVLRYANQWQLGPDFEAWLEANVSFHNTLVDRIVPGYPKNQLEAYQALVPYQDQFMVTAESFFLWVIEGNEALRQQLPFERTGLDVLVVPSMQPYRTRKVRILNGAHTALVSVALLQGIATVREAMENTFAAGFVQTLVFDEILPTLDLPKAELEGFAHQVFDRFRNPYIEHQWSSIALNSVSKFVVRVWPSIEAYHGLRGQLPTGLCFSLAALLRFYQGSSDNKPLPVNDHQDVLQRFAQAWQHTDLYTVAQQLLADEQIWGQNLLVLPQLAETVAAALTDIERHGVVDGFEHFAARTQPISTFTA